MTRSTAIIFACCLVLWICISQLNHYLAPLHLSLFAGGLLITFSALRMGFREGWWSSLLIGLLIDSSTAVPFGFHGLLFAVVHTAVYNLRGRFPREETIFGLIVALLANLALFFMITVAFLLRSPAPFSMLPRLLADLLASELVVFFAAPWFFALQDRSLELCGLSPDVNSAACTDRPWPKPPQSARAAWSKLTKATITDAVFLFRCGGTAARPHQRSGLPAAFQGRPVP